MPDPLANYKQLILRVDALCGTIAATLGAQITCSAGCSSCCAAITVFPVEAAAMRESLASLPAQQQKEIERHLSEQPHDECCPLLNNNRCMLYTARPIICRTHGLPIIYTADGQRTSDCCPLNLHETGSLPGSSVIDLDTLNPLLVAVNAIYLTQSNSIEPDVRVTITAALGFI